MVKLLPVALFGLLLQAGSGYTSAIKRDVALRASGALTIQSTSPLEIEYHSPEANSKNWVGVYYAAGGGPDNGQHNQDSVRWSYAPNAQGKVTLPTEGLGAGKYKAYLLENDGYKSLAAPVEFSYGNVGNYPGSVSVDYSRTPLNFKYTTSQPNDQNWVGIYFADGGGPVDQKQDQPSITWEWAKGPVGEVTLSAANLQPGQYKVFFLADGGYKWLAEPISVSVQSNGPFTFIVKEFTTPNARQGEKFSAKIGGLLSNAGLDGTRFAISGDKSWLSINPEGILSGTPSQGAKDTTVKVEATSKDGSTASLNVHVPVRSSNAQLVEDLRLLSFNLWYGGTKVNNYHEKQVKFLVDQNVDIVGFQESSGGHGTRLAHTLGWFSWQGSDVSIISRYPIAEAYSATSVSGSVRISLDGNKADVIFWNCHLGAYPYGPYGFCFDKMNLNQVMKLEADSGRTSQIQELTQKMANHLSNADNIPVFLVGDFNAPSHLDWTTATKSQHCNAGQVNWPTSKYPVDAGLVDSFRVAYPDAVKTPGITWSPIYLDNEGRPEPLDRIDFVYHKGNKLTVVDSQALVAGNPTAEPNQQDNEWPSDHKSVLTHYKVKF